jgi:hypothetical protein
MVENIHAATDLAEGTAPTSTHCLLHKYSAKRPLVLLTDHGPDFGGGGAVILRSLLGPRDYERLVWITLAPVEPMTRADGLRVLPLRRGHGLLASTMPSSTLLDSTLRMRHLANEVRAIAQANNAGALWSVLHNAVVPITGQLARSRAIRMHCTVHDDPGYAMALRSRRQLAFVPWIDYSLRAALKGADSVDVVCAAMADRYKARWQVNAAIVHRALEDRVLPVSSYDRAAHGLRIAVLGSTYGYPQLRTLAGAVAKAAKATGVQGKLTFIGKGHASRLKAETSGLDIEAIGHVDEARAIEVLRSCYLQYLNYPFGLRDRILRQTSFPTKLSTYLQSARPVLMHMPTDSSAIPLKQFGPLAVHWDNMNEDAGAEKLAAAWREETLTGSLHHEAELARRAFYDAETHRRTLGNALNSLVD